jgi:putative (di)nucleoside polyphosphate hydrolase
MKIDLEKLTYRQSTVALIIDNNKDILIVQKNSYQPNEWDFPGGGIDENEEAEQTILRELKEELGSDKFEILKRDKDLDKYNWPENYILWRYKKYGELHRGQERVRYLVKFLGEKSEIKIEKEEIRKYQWVKIKDLKKYLIFPNYIGKIGKILTDLGIEK